MSPTFEIRGTRKIAALVAASVAATASVIALLVNTLDDGDAEQDPAAYLSGVVQIGVGTDAPGWTEYNNGVWDGFDIALANWLAEELNFKPRYVPVSSRERMLVLQEGTGDDGQQGQRIKLVIANFSITDERRRDIDFVGPYLADSQGLMTRAGSPIKLREHIQGKTVCVPTGSTPEERLFEMDIQPAAENTTGRCIERLRAGQVDAVSTDRAILEGFVARTGAKDVVVADRIRVGTELYGIGLPNNRPKLCEFLRKKLVKFINEEWDQKFRDKLPGISPADRKPNSGTLDPCEAPTTTE